MCGHVSCLKEEKEKKKSIYLELFNMLFSVLKLGFYHGLHVSFKLILLLVLKMKTWKTGYHRMPIDI